MHYRYPRALAQDLKQLERNVSVVGAPLPPLLPPLSSPFSPTSPLLCGLKVCGQTRFGFHSTWMHRFSRAPAYSRFTVLGGSIASSCLPPLPPHLTTFAITTTEHPHVRSRLRCTHPHPLQHLVLASAQVAELLADAEDAAAILHVVPQCLNAKACVQVGSMGGRA